MPLPGTPRSRQLSIVPLHKNLAGYGALSCMLTPHGERFGVKQSFPVLRCTPLSFRLASERAPAVKHCRLLTPPHDGHKPSELLA
jgi:hypothetical protein